MSNDNLIKKDSPAGKKLQDIIGDGSRAIITAENIGTIVASLESAVGDVIPMLFAGKTQEAMLATEAGFYMVGLVAVQVKEGDSKETFYKAVMVRHMPTLDELMESEQGRDFLYKVMEKEIAHVSFRPIRTAGDVQEIRDSASQIPFTIEELTTASRSGKIDNSTIAILWPMLVDYLANKVDEDEEGNPILDDDGNEVPNKAYRAVAKVIPSAAASKLSDVSKLLRSKSWTEKNYPELEEGGRGIGDWLGQLLLTLGSNPLPVGPEGEDGEPTMIQLDLSQVEEWLENREETNIEPVGGAAEEVDLSALDEFLQN